MRYYSSQAPAVDLTGSITNVATAITVSSTTGFPGTTPFTLVLDPGQPTEEIVEVTNVSGLTLTITRAVDGSSAQAHSASVGNVRHMATARDYREPQDHIAASTNIHGLAAGAAVVGTTSTQTLTNKTLQASAAGAVGAVVKGTASQSASYFEVQDNTGATLLKVQPGVATLTVGSAQVNGAGADNLFGFLAKFTSSAAGIVTGIFKRASGQTADIIQIQNESAGVLAKFDKDANLSVPSITSAGAVSGTAGTFSGQVTSNGVNAVTLTETQTLINKTLDTASLINTTTAATLNATVALKVNGVNVVTEDDTGWVNLTAATNWSAMTSPYVPAVRRFRGIIYLRGGFVRGAGAGATMCTLPAGSRPSQQQFLSANVASDGTAYELVLQTDGTLALANGYATGSSSTGANHPIAGYATLT